MLINDLEYTLQALIDIERDECEPEKQLILEVIERAIRDSFSNINSEKHFRREARAWINCTPDKDTPFTFAWCCAEISESDGQRIFDGVRKFIKQPVNGLYKKPSLNHPIGYRR